MQTPTSPVNLACAQAMKAASSSCRACTNSHLLAHALEGAHQAVDAVAGIAEHAPHAPGMQALEHLVAGRFLAHAFLHEPSTTRAASGKKCGSRPAPWV